MLDRRTFLIRSGRVAAGAVGSHVLQGLLARQAQAATCDPAGPSEGSYGPLEPAGPELALPAGFKYRKFGVTGDLMSDGRLTPTAHDGMAAFGLSNGNIRLVRNHEIPGPPVPGTIIGNPALGYDLFAGGGTTSLEVKPNGNRRLVRNVVSLSGTLNNVFNRREFAGATFSPDGQTLFVNIQGDVPPNLGMTFAIWGHWEQGAL